MKYFLSFTLNLSDLWLKILNIVNVWKKKEKDQVVSYDYIIGMLGDR